MAGSNCGAVSLGKVDVDEIMAEREVLVKEEPVDDMWTIKEEEEEVMMPDQEVPITVERCFGCGVVKSEQIDLDVVKQEYDDPDWPTSDLVVRDCRVVVTKLSDKEIQEWMKKSENGIRLYKCDHCDYQAVRKIHLTSHLSIHEAENPLQCDFKTSRNHALKWHKRYIQEKNPFKCDYCGYIPKWTKRIISNAYPYPHE